MGGIIGCVIGLAWRTVASSASGIIDGIGVILVCGSSAAATSLVSWQHRPGLPGFATAAAVGMCLSSRAVAPPQLWLVWTTDVVWLMSGFLVAYAAAWMVDTQIVFRSLPQRPPPKRTSAYLLLARYLPCCLVTGAGGLLVFLWGAGGRPVNAVLVALAFGLSGAAGVAAFPTVSTLWVTLGVLWVAAVMGLVGLADTHGALTGNWAGWSAARFVGVGVGGALGGFGVARYWQVRRGMYAGVPRAEHDEPPRFQ